MNKRIAIIGAAMGQLPLCQKAREMGLETYCFAWSQGAVCKDYVDHFIPISITEKDAIVQYCLEHKIDGVVSNASETTAAVVSYVAEKLGKAGTPYQVLKNIQNKAWVREQTNKIPGLSPVFFKVGLLNHIFSTFSRPCVLKPITGASKKGVNFVDNTVNKISVSDDLKKAMFMMETYIAGKEYSVESMSYQGNHQVIQITEKITTGAPHFVELEHHQPASLAVELEEKIRHLIPMILSAVGYVSGASHTEIKIDDENRIYLIELNPRGAGGHISDTLIHLSTDYDYLEQLILMSLDEPLKQEVHQVAYAGIYFLTAFTARLLPYFEQPLDKWMYKRERLNSELRLSCSNYDRDGFIIYCSNKKIQL